jgi:hypothetical protein
MTVDDADGRGFRGSAYNRCAMLRRLDDFPAATAPRDRELMRARCVQDVDGGGPERIGTEQQHRLTADETKALCR